MIDFNVYAFIDLDSSDDKIHFFIVVSYICYLMYVAALIIRGKEDKRVIRRNIIVAIALPIIYLLLIAALIFYWNYKDIPQLEIYKDGAIDFDSDLVKNNPELSDRIIQYNKDYEGLSGIKGDADIDKYVTMLNNKRKSILNDALKGVDMASISIHNTLRSIFAPLYVVIFIIAIIAANIKK